MADTTTRRSWLNMAASSGTPLTERQLDELEPNELLIYVSFMHADLAPKYVAKFNDQEKAEYEVLVRRSE